MVYYDPMKNFNVTYRGKDGKQDLMQIAAEDRNGVFAELAKRGISAIRVEEAKGKLKNKKPVSKRSNSIGNGVRIAAWGVVGLVVAVAGHFIASNLGGGRDAEDGGERKSGRIVDATPATHNPADGGGAAKPKSAHDIAEEFTEQAKEFIKKAVTNETQWIVPPLDPDDPDNALRSRVCQELGSLLSIEPGEPMPPFPYSFLLEDDMREAAAKGEDVGEIDNGNKAFLDSLAKYKIMAKETDDEHRLEHKEKLITAQSELLGALDEGYSVNDTIRAAYEFRKQAYETRTELSNLLREIAEEEDTDIKIFKEQLEIANARLKEQGIKTIPLEEILPEYEDEDSPDDEQETDD